MLSNKRPLLFVLLLFLNLSGCYDVVEKKYNKYGDIAENDGVLTWLPRVFPDAAIDIAISMDLDVNTFYVYFSLSDEEAAVFERNLDMKTSPIGRQHLEYGGNNVATWCKLSPYKLDGFGDEEELYLISKIENHRYYLSKPYGSWSQKDGYKYVHENLKKYCISANDN